MSWSAITQRVGSFTGYFEAVHGGVVSYRLSPAQKL